MNDADYLYLKRRVLALTSIDIDAYKSQQMRRRLGTFLARSPGTNIVSYCRMLENDEDMLKRLQDFLTINVSEFFRDLPQFERLKTSVVPELLRHRASLNVWSAGCSCGAESYSLAMLLEELCPNRPHRILGTDIDEASLVRAQAGGPYGAGELRNVPRRFLLAYFAPSAGGQCVPEGLRRKVEFRRHNLLCDEFEEGFDLIACRNVTIYFTEAAKAGLNRRFHSALREGGVLLVGATEIMLDAAEIGFTRTGPGFYRKLSGAAAAGIPRVSAGFSRRAVGWPAAISQGVLNQRGR